MDRDEFSHRPSHLDGTASIRLAQRREAEAIAVMSRDLIELGLGWNWTSARVARAVGAPEHNVAVAHVGERLAGFGIMVYGDRSAHLCLLAVKPKFQRRGVARSLVEWLEATALVAGLEQVSLEVRATNQGAIDFYRRLGFQMGNRINGYYSGKEAAVTMHHQIRRSSTVSI